MVNGFTLLLQSLAEYYIGPVFELGGIAFGGQKIGHRITPAIPAVGAVERAEMKTVALTISLFVHGHPFAIFQKLGLIVLLHPVVTGNTLQASGVRVIVIKANLRPLDGLDMLTGTQGT